MDENILTGIYKIQNKENNKVYIGQTVNYLRRINEYKNRKASVSGSSNYNIMQHIEKDGWDKYEMEFIFSCNPSELDYWEMFYIRKYESFNPDKGYNSFHLDENGKLVTNNVTKEKMRKAHIGLTESADTKRKKSNKIIAINENEMIFIISDSAKLFGDKIGVSKDMIKNGLRQPSKIKGYRLYYFEPNKRKDIVKKMLKKRSIRDKMYIPWCEYLDNRSVETIEKNFQVIYLTYED